MMRMARAMLYDEEEARDVVSEVFATMAERRLPIKSVEGYLRYRFYVTPSKYKGTGAGNAEKNRL